MKQTVVSFVYGVDRAGLHNTMMIEDQINEFLREHSNYKISSISTIVTSLYQEALVVFDILDEETDLNKLLRREETRGEREPREKEGKTFGQNGNQRKN